MVSMLPVAPALLRAAEAAPAFALAEALRWTWRPAADLVGGRGGPISAMRTATEAYARLLPDARGVDIEPVTIDCADACADGCTDDCAARRLTAEWSIPRDPRPGAILYLHGGGFVFGSPRTHRVITGRLAADSRLPVLTPRYRLAPEHPFPAAFDDALAAYRYLLATGGVTPGQVVIAGDSSGGHLAAGLVAALGARGLPAPAGVILFSPWLDLGCVEARLADQQHRDPFVSMAAAERLARLYLGGGEGGGGGNVGAGLGASHPYPMAPLIVPTSPGPQPPFLIQVGGRESLRHDARQFADDMIRAGAACRFQVWPGQIHAFQLLNRWLPSARAALWQAAEFAAACTA